MSKYLTCLIGISLIFSSCLKDPSAEQFVDLSNAFEISLSQELGDVRIPTLTLTTVEEQDCTETEINSTLIEASKDIILEINSLTIPQNCNGDNQVIRKSHPINSNNGYYQFSVTLTNAEANNGSMRIANQVVELELETLQGISAKNLELNMIEDQFMWGYIHSDNEGKDIGQIREALFTNFPTTQINPVKTIGHYGLFSLQEDQSIRIYDLDNAEHQFYGNYSNQSWELLKENIDIILEDPLNNDLLIHISNEKGQVLGNL